MSNISTDPEEKFAIVNAVTGEVVKQLTHQEYHALQRAMEWPEERAARLQREAEIDNHFKDLAHRGFGFPTGGDLNND